MGIWPAANSLCCKLLTNMYDTPSGAYRPLNLLLPQFEFAEPVHVMNDWIKGSVDWEAPISGLRWTPSAKLECE